MKDVTRERGRPKIKWKEVVSKDLQLLSNNIGLAKDTAQWKKKVHIGDS